MTEVEVQLLTDFIMENPIIFGIVLIIIGIPIALFGQRWFKYVCSGFGGFSAFIIAAFSAEDLGFMDETSGLWICLVVSVIIGIVIGIILYNFVKIGSVLIGITCGACIGLMLWAFISYWMTEKYIIVSLVSTIVFAVLGAVFGIKYGSKAILYGTSLIGSYTFMRGWSLIFKGYVGEQ